MSIGEDLLTYLLADSSIASAVGTRCHQNKAPHGYDGQYIWFGRAATENADAIDDAAGTAPFRQYFDVECCSDDIDEAIDLADLVKAKHLARGSFGAGTIQGVFVTDHADDYIPRGVNSDEGMHVAALQLELVGYTGA